MKSRLSHIAAMCLLLSMYVVAAPQPAALKLYVFDCGMVALDSLAMFNLKPGESDVRELFVPCYLIQHDKGLLFFDGGLPKAIADAGAPVTSPGSSVKYDRWIMDQLAQMGIASADITYTAFSHLHFDHAGAANNLAAGTVLMQQAEWDVAFEPGREHVDPRLFDGLKQAKLQLLNGDHDVFGDGSVRLIYTPGHTPGHQSLWVDLQNTGPVVLSGDLYHTRANRELRRSPTFNYNVEDTLASMDRVEKLLQDTGAMLWIEHDKALADTLKKAPEYYD